MRVDRVRESKITMMDLSGKKVLVVGLGISGISASRLLLARGANLWITEREDNPQVRTAAEDLTRQGAVIELGRHTQDFLKDKDLVVISPGVLPNNEIIKWANNYKIPIVSELELASWYVTYPLVCITGTNGKSTVTSLIDHIFRYAGKKSVACGNLGMPLSEIVLNHKDLDVAVVEVSSFQLEYIKDFKPKVSIWLNFSYDHLDHHLDMEEYLKAKLRIFKNQGKDDWAIINYRELDRVGNIKAKKFIYGKGNYSGVTQLKGRHNEENILAAVTTARIYGIKDQVIKDAVKGFRPLEHRMEFAANINGTDFINDSKATNVHAVIQALEGLPNPVILILGGRDKGDDFTRLRDIVKEKADCVVVLGEAKEKIISQLAGVVPFYEAQTIEDAVECAYGKVPAGRAGATVLLSPGCSSFDMFRDYEERGEKFKEAVIKLKIKDQKSKIKNKDGVSPHTPINLKEICYYEK